MAENYRIDGDLILIGADRGSSALKRVDFLAKDAPKYDEAWLQRLIHRHPDALPLGQIEPGFDRLVAVCMELPTKNGSIDNLLMTRDGDIVIVEAKLWRNAEARREVVAQALDYASCLFEMGYDEFESAALKADFGDRERPKRLYDALAAHDSLDEPRFTDRVSLNLRNGRIVVLVVGDGIRTEVERLSAMLQSHGGFHFTFALVEMAVFHLPDGKGFLVHPRTLARTRMIERGIVRIDDQRVKVTLAPPSEARTSAVAVNITEDQFFDAMKTIREDVPERLKAFLASLDKLDVYPEFLRTLILRWDAPNGESINLGYIHRDGAVWTDASNWKAPHDLSHRYNEELAAALGLDVEKIKLKDNWHIRYKGHAPRIDMIADRLDKWRPVIDQFVGALRQRLVD